MNWFWRHKPKSPAVSARNVLRRHGALARPGWALTVLLFLMPIVCAQSAPPSAAEGGEAITLNFSKISTRDALYAIAHFARINLAISDNVKGDLTLKLNQVSWQSALQSILDMRGLVQRKSGDVIWIAPQAEIADKEKQLLETQHSSSNVEAIQTQRFRLSYAKAQDVEKQLNGQANPVTGQAGPRILSPRGSAMAEARTNQLFISDTPQRLASVAAMIRQLDIPLRQVLIEAQIIEADESFGQNLGAKFGGYLARSVNATQRAWGGAGMEGVVIKPNDTVAPNSTNIVDLTADGLGGRKPAAFGLAIFNSALSQLLSVEISALAQQGQGKIVAKPRLITADQNKAVIEQGTELPYQVHNAQGSASMQFKKANLKLEVTPRITPEGAIMLDLEISKDSVGRITAAGYAIDTKRIQTQVLVENGGTVSIGGIYEEAQRAENEKVPLLGDIPLLGALFSSNKKSKAKTELFVFVTPRLISAQGDT